ncbi:MAG: hypothetical protein AAGI07_11070 [Bacteroidota bacterium]
MTNNYKVFLVLLCLFLPSYRVFAQEEDYASKYFDEAPKNENTLNPEQPQGFDDAFLTNAFFGNNDSLQNFFSGNIGFTQIGDQQYVGMRLQPELGFGKIGLGLDIPLLFNIEDGSMRTEEFERGIGALRLVRYFRYGIKKRDPLYVRVGDITGSYLGYGILLNNYTNSISYERRKLGLNFDVRVAEMFGLEGIYSDLNFTSLNLLALRPYVRPFAKTAIPIVRSVEFGGSYVTDRDHTSQLELSTEEVEVRNKTVFFKEGINAWSADMGVTFLKIPFITVMGAVQYAKIQQNQSDSLTAYFNQQIESGSATGTPLEDGYQAGDGLSVGLNAKINFIGNLLRVDARIDRLWYSDHFLPQFFDTNYEINKDLRMINLGTAEKMNGIYGVLSASILDKIRVSGSLLMPDEVSEESPALLQLNAELINLFDHIMLRASYIKGGLTQISDITTLDDRSLASLRLAYQLNKFLVVGADYQWTYALQEDGQFKADHYFMPYFGFNFPLGRNKYNDKEVRLDK